MFDCTCLHGIDHLVCHRKNRSMAKSCHQFLPTVDSGKFLVCFISAKRECFLNDRSKVLILSDVYHSRIGNRLCCEDSVCIACFRRHQAVRRIENRSRKVCKFLLLVLPCRTKVTFQMFVFFQLWICMSRKHLPMCINVDSLSFGLLQKFFQVIEIMTGNHNKWSFFYRKCDFGRRRCAKGLCVCLIKHCHTGKVHLSHFQNNRKKLLHAPVRAHNTQCFVKEGIDSCVIISQHCCMVRISSHPADSKKNQGFERTNILISLPQLLHVIIFCFAKLTFFLLHAHSQLLNRCIIKIYVCQRCKKSFHHQFVQGCDMLWSFSFRCTGQSDQRSRQFILKSCNLSSLTTDTCISLASAASCSLFTLKTKHFLFHHNSSCEMILYVLAIFENGCLFLLLHV